eukprot:jgi/Mesvir1/22567/Mv18571-RA.2
MRAAKRMCNIDATRSALRSPPKIFCGQAAPWPSLAAGCCLFMTLVLLGVSTPSCAASSGDIVSTYDKDGDGLLNAGEIEHLMVAVLKRPDERAACPNASSLLSSRDIDGDQKLDSTEMEGVSWDFLQCRPTRDAMMSAGEAIVTTSTGSYACAAEHHRDEHHEDEAYEREPADKSDGDEHAEEEVGHGDGHGDGRGGEHLDDSAVSLTFPGGIPVTWHCKPTEGHGEPEEEEDSVKNSVSERWGLAILASILISLISLVGVILLTCVTNFAQHSLHHASDYMSSLAVGAIISLIFTHLLPEAAEGDKDGRFAWRTGTAVLGGIMTGYLLKSLVRCVRTCMGIHSHECGVVCADLPVFTAPEKQGVKKAAPRQPASLPMGHPVLLEEDEGAKCVTHGGEDSLPAGTGQKMTAIEVQDKAGQEAPGPVGTMCHSHDDTHEHRPSLKHRMTMRMVSVKSVAFAILLGDLVCNLVDGLVIGVSFSRAGHLQTMTPRDLPTAYRCREHVRQALILELYLIFLRTNMVLWNLQLPICVFVLRVMPVPTCMYTHVCMFSFGGRGGWREGQRAGGREEGEESLVAIS